MAIAVKVNEQMVPGTNRMQPTAKSNSQRIPGYDLARSLAIFGMVIVNYSSFMGGWGVGPGWLVWLVELLPGRAAAIFVVLAGVGMSLMARQGRDSDNRLEKQMIAKSLLKRASFLFIVGLAHYYLLWSADILHYYGVYLAVGAFLLFKPAKMLWSIAALLIVMFFLMSIFMDYETGWDFRTMYYADFWTPAGFFRNLFFNGFHPVFPWLAFLLVGLWLGRQNPYDRSRRRRIILTSAAIAIITELASWLSTHYLISGAAWFTMEEIGAFFGRESKPPLPLFMLQTGSMAIFIISLSVGITERFTRAFCYDRFF